jgi:hypothetical protein
MDPRKGNLAEVAFNITQGIPSEMSGSQRSLTLLGLSGLRILEICIYISELFFP